MKKLLEKYSKYQVISCSNCKHRIRFWYASDESWNTCQKLGLEKSKHNPPTCEDVFVEDCSTFEYSSNIVGIEIKELVTLLSIKKEI